MKRFSFFLPLFMLSLSANAGKQVSNVQQYQVAIKEACEASEVGGACIVEFVGGTVGVGLCVASPETGALECSVNLPEVQENCKNTAFSHSPSSALTFAGLLGSLLLLRLRRRH